jgi:hypothetical protein
MPFQSKPQLMTQSEYARYRGKSRQYISKLAKAGVLVMRGGKVDVRATDTVLDDRPVDDVNDPPATAAPPRPSADSLGGQTSTSFGQARTVEMVFRAKLRRLEFETRQGKLIEAEAVRKTIADAVRSLRDGILGLPDRMATVLAAESDSKKVHVMLKTELTRELENLANAIDAI